MSRDISWIVVLCMALSCTPAGPYRSSVDEKAVRADLIAGGIVGGSEAEARAQLQALHLPRGSELTLGSAPIKWTPS